MSDGSDDKTTDLSHLALFQQPVIVDAQLDVDRVILDIYQHAHGDRGLILEKVGDPTMGLVNTVQDDELEEGGWRALMDAVEERWRPNTVRLADVAPALGSAFAHIQGPSQNTPHRELVLNRQNQGLRTLRHLRGEGLAAAAGHIVELSTLLEAGQLAGDRFESVCDQFCVLVLALAASQPPPADVE